MLGRRIEGLRGGSMRLLTKPKASCGATEKVAQCCAKASRLVSGCHD